MALHHTIRPSVFNFTSSPSQLEREPSPDGIQTFLSAPIATPFPFSSLVLSANFAPSSEGSLLLEAQVGVGGKWSGFYKLGFLSEKLKTSFPAQQDECGQVQTDLLALAHPADALRFRVRINGALDLSLVAGTVVRAPFEYDEKVSARLPAGCFAKVVEPISQMEQKHPERRRICSPTSLCMALNALGISVQLPDVMDHVFDQTALIYGNWVFNVAAAGAVGAEAYVRRFGSLDELKDFVTEQSLVVASIAYGPNDLPGAPLEKTAGHLVVIRGWEKDQVLTADPAAPTKETVLRAYNAREFAKAWLLRKQGVAYVVRRK